MKSKTRCTWARSPLLAEYHDREWGVPVHKDRKLFEFIVLDGMQAGLSWEIVLRKRDRPEDSYTTYLFDQGLDKILKKVGEEAVETAMAAVSGDKQAVANESADLLYHLAVLWAAAGVTPDEVYAVLAQREGRSGLDEKASRGRS